MSCRASRARLRACAVWGICTRGAVWSLGGLEATRGPKNHNKPTLHCSRTAPRIALPPSGLVSKIRSGRSNPQALLSDMGPRCGYDGMQRRRRERHGWRVLIFSGRVTGFRESGGYPIPVGRVRLRPRNWVALATTNGQACERVGGEWSRKAEHGGVWTCRFAGCVSNCPCLGSVWTRRTRFPGACAIGGSSTWRLGGLSGRFSSPAQWQRPRKKWICARAPHRATKPTWGSDAQAGLMRIPAFCSQEVSLKKAILVTSLEMK